MTSGRTWVPPLSARETVPRETPARRATSSMVGHCRRSCPDRPSPVLVEPFTASATAGLDPGLVPEKLEAPDRLEGSLGAQSRVHRPGQKLVARRLCLFDERGGGD